MTTRNDDPVLSELVELVGELTTDFIEHSSHRRFRVPARPTPLDPICDVVGADPGSDPHSISRNLFAMEWDSLPGYSTIWQLHALRLPSGDRAYWVDDLEGRRIVAVGPGGPGADGKFARTLFRSNGQDFHAPILDSAPSRISTCLRGERLVSLFLDAFHCSSNAWEAVDGFGRSAIRRWLKTTLANGGRELRPGSTQAGLEEFLRVAERIVSDFTPHGEDPRIRIAPRFTPTAPLAKHAGLSRKRLPRMLSRGVIRFVWWGAPGSSSTWELNAFDLHTSEKVYWIETDFGDESERDKRHIIGTASGDVSDAEFAQVFFGSNGKVFGVDGCCGSPPMEISTNLPAGPFLTDLFVSAFTAARSFDRLDVEGRGSLDLDDPQGRRELVARYLKEVVD